MPVNAAINIQTAKDKKKKTQAETSIQIPRLELSTFKMTLVGQTPLMVQKFSEKAKRMIQEKQAKKAKTARAARDPVAEYQASLYVIDAKKKIYGVPVSGLKNCAVSACGFIEGIFKTTARGAFHILCEPHGLVPITGGDPVMDERTVRLSGPGRPADMRYRARFDKWELTFMVQYNKNVISAEQILNLFENSGFSIGLCEYRPEKNGSYGMFKVKRG